jgi:phosphatidylinositol kinase/protein kinase (PI-3  family)
MLCPDDGRLFHIDYGYTLGREPKPVPPGPFRLSLAMVEAMGGRDHANFSSFKRLCVEVSAQKGGGGGASMPSYLTHKQATPSARS